ncbi:NAD(P)H-dependent oxidoreductase [Achromobacter xylosoxidans]|uniref:NAD(P)H-dependent oxidoreductase n=1 Tax=Alcaligenes xylosoxydans xylosoxydans TaxID=85698 RepID=UPI00292E3FD2|nr:NAD(P)H-dependent oxidoreductase [Achromobacter xylosoxidans]WOB74236.1 NAD(P)H-dependent oxidoreductase [Achromobacter xylosoxidans]
MRLLALAGSPSARSRSSALLRRASERLQTLERVVDAMGLLDIPAQNLVQGHYAGEAAVASRARVSQAGAVPISAPVYKASSLAT